MTVVDRFDRESGLLATFSSHPFNDYSFHTLCFLFFPIEVLLPALIDDGLAAPVGRICARSLLGHNTGFDTVTGYIFHVMNAKLNTMHA